MKIRNKITLIFILLTGSLLAGVFIFIYLFSNRYTENEFYQRLNERANIIGQSYLEKDEVSSKVYEQILKKHYQVLPSEEEAVFKINVLNRTIEDSLSEKFPDEFIAQVFQKKRAQLKRNNTYLTGILYSDNQGDFMVVVSAKNQYGQAKMNNLRNILIIAFIAGIIAIYLLGRYYAGKVLYPISEITGKAKEISATNLHLRLDTGNNKDELAELSETFNDMLDRLETTFEMQNNFINNASHELKNPLAAILGEAEVTLKKDRLLDEYKTSLSTIEKEAQRLELLVNSLLKLAQTGHDKKGLLIEAIRVDELVMEVKEGIDKTNSDNNILFNFSRLPEHSEALVVSGNHHLLTVALTNVLDNACKFSNNNEVVVKIATINKFIEISIKDHGIGIPQDELKSVSDPFYRAANVRAFKGFGIGLPLAQRIIKLHGGKMNISSEVLKGTEVKIIFPTK